MSETLIRWFADLDLQSRPSVGGKGASLGELMRAGIAVPPGFVLTTTAFDRALAALDADGSIRRTIGSLDPQDLDAVIRVTAQARECIERAPLPPDVLDAITGAYRELCAGDAGLPVAVRSSATSEDSAEASFAGLQDTYLWVCGAAEVVHRVRACWASLYSTESVSYRLRLGLAETHVAMGVVVQRMVNSRSSGVMFTRSPTTGDRSVVAIEASWGLGSGIVSGEVTPDKYVVSKITGEIAKRTVSTKLVQHFPDLQAGCVRTAEVPPELQTTASISDEEIHGLVAIARQVEQHYGTPQDIEWAIAPGPDGNFAVYLLQSRPETVWANRDAQPVAKPAHRPFDHVLAALSGRKSRGP